MQVEAFEQLVSAWLDEPQRAALRREIDAALQQQPELGPLLAQYERLEQRLRETPPAWPPIVWPNLYARITAAVHEAAEDDVVARGLGALPALDGQVDWTRLQRRVSQAVRAQGGRRRRGGQVLRPFSAVAGLLATAATLALFTFSALHSRDDAAPAAPAAPMLARAVVLPPAVARPVSEAARLVHLAVLSEPASGGDVLIPAERPRGPRVYFTIEPPAPTPPVALSYAGAL